MTGKAYQEVPTVWQRISKKASVPRKMTFDNSKVNTRKILYRRGTEPSIGLLQLTSHHLFEPHFCRICEPQEKGHVENCVKYVRNNFMVPVPHFPTFAAFNEYLEQKCRSEFAKTSAGQEKTIGQLFGEEKLFLLSLPEVEFEARRTALCSGAAFESREVPQFEDSGELRLQSPTESEQDAGQSVDAWRIHRESGVDHFDQSAGEG